MTTLLLTEAFDHFLFIEGEITTYNQFHIDGYVRREFFAGEDTGLPEDSYSRWSRLRDFCFSLIRGRRTPLDFRMIFSLPEEEIRRLIQEKELDFQPETVQGLYLNFRYHGLTLTCTTGTSLSVLTLDKSLEQAFDLWVREFFAACGMDWKE